ncbi:8706_t:CDS:2, partial [Acaulospora morrowiae]
KKVHELRTMCLERGLPKEGAKNKLISQLELYDLEIASVKQESMEVDCVDVPVLASTASEETGSLLHEASTQDAIQPPSQPKFPAVPSPPESSHSIENNEETLESVDESLGQRDQSEVTSSLPASATTSPIVHHAAIEVPTSINNFQQNQTAPSFETPPSTRQPTLHESSSCQNFVSNEIDHELFNRLIAERKQLCMIQSSNIHRLYNKGVMINQARGVQYNYDLLLKIIQSSLVYNDGEIPLWLKEAYDTSVGTSYWEASVVSPGIDADEIFLLKDDVQMVPMEFIF